MIFEFFSDPAFPPFYFTPGWISRALGKSDADFVSFFYFKVSQQLKNLISLIQVDVIHTDSWIYGAPVSTGEFFIEIFC